MKNILMIVVCISAMCSGLLGLNVARGHSAQIGPCRQCHPIHTAEWNWDPKPPSL